MNSYNFRPNTGCFLCTVCLMMTASALSPSPLGASSITSPGSGAKITVLESSERQVMLELRIADYDLKPGAGVDGNIQIVIPGTTQTASPGQPQMPTLGVLVGLPTIDDVSVEIVEATSEELTNIQLPMVASPPPNPSFFDGTMAVPLDANVVAQAASSADDVFLPQAPVRLGTVGYLRQQAVAQLQFHPMLYNAARHQIKLYRHLVVRLRWRPAEERGANGGKQNNRLFAPLLDKLLINPGTPATFAQAKVQTGSKTKQPTRLPDFDKAALKIAVDKPGLYRLAYADLQQAGFSPDGIDPRTLQLYQPEGEVAILVTGEEDGRFDSTDAILFYGVSAPSVYSDLNFYWLTIGNSLGKRIQLRNAAPTLNPTPEQQFVTTLHAEENANYWQAMVGNGEDRWFWGRRLSPNTTDLEVSRSYPITLYQVAANADAILRVRLKGFSGYEHHTRIYLNDSLVDDRQWYGQVPFIHVAALTQNILRNGENQVKVQTLATNAQVDQLLVDWIEMDYGRTYAADDDALLFTTSSAGLKQFALTGFTTSDLLLFDVSDPLTPVQMNGARLEADTDGVTLRFEETTLFGAKYLALATTKSMPPAFLQLDQPSDWRSRNNGADYIIITHEAFYPNALQLAAHRQSQGLRTAVVKIGDIYDEFSAGRFRTQAIRDFLSYAFENWQAPAPTYVVLLGDAAQDYKDNLKSGTLNYVPSQNIDTHFGEFSSDQWFATIKGDDPLPDLLIGRLAVQSPEEAATVVEKLIAYDQQPLEDSWHNQMLFVADDDEASFRSLSEQLIGLLPSGLFVQTLLASNYPPGDMATNLVNAFNQGRSIVNYVGHGSYLGWGQWDGNSKQMLDTTTVTTLNNGPRLPFVVVANCLNGFFAASKQNSSLAEVLQRHPGGGAVAIFAPSGVEYAAGNQILMHHLYSAIFTDFQVALGSAVNVAKLATYATDNSWEELVATYLLFGDPATNLQIPGLYSQRIYFPTMLR